MDVNGNMDVIDIRRDLMAMREEPYAAFQAKLVPNIDSSRILGVRMPLLRRYAKSLRDDSVKTAFFKDLPHAYHEENLLHALLLSELQGDFDAVVAEFQAFLPYVDNWAVTDCFSPRVFDVEPARARAFCLSCLDSAHPYTVRFGIVMLLYRSLRETFDPAILPRLASLSEGEYYIDMAVAWYLSQALAFDYEQTLPVLEQSLFSRFVHNKAIQKAIESYRISDAHKAELRLLRRHGKAESEEQHA